MQSCLIWLELTMVKVVIKAAIDSDVEAAAVGATGKVRPAAAETYSGFGGALVLCDGWRLTGAVGAETDCDSWTQRHRFGDYVLDEFEE